jgi:hypothetical protein
MVASPQVMPASTTGEFDLAGTGSPSGPKRAATASTQVLFKTKVQIDHKQERS